MAKENWILSTKEDEVKNVEIEENIKIIRADKFKSKNTTQEEMKIRLRQIKCDNKQHKTYAVEIWIMNKNNLSNFIAIEMEYWRRCKVTNGK